MKENTLKMAQISSDFLDFIVKQLSEKEQKEQKEFQDEFDMMHNLKLNLAKGENYALSASKLLLISDSIAYEENFEKWREDKLHEQFADIHEYINQTKQGTQISELVEAIKSQMVVPFIGAGLSCQNGLPSWGGALRELFEKVKDEDDDNKFENLKKYEKLRNGLENLEKKEFLEAANYFYSYDSTITENFLSSRFRLKTGERICGALSLLPDLFKGCIITTNFDSLIEEAYLGERKPIKNYMHGIQKEHNFHTALSRGERSILKLHGSSPDIDTYIFSKKQYDKAYGSGEIDFSKPLAKILRQIYVSRNLLFLGCSLEEDITLKLFKKVIDNKEFFPSKHYAMLPDIADKKEKKKKETRMIQYNISPIWFRVKHNSYEELNTLLGFVKHLVLDELRL